MTVEFYASNRYSVEAVGESDLVRDISELSMEDAWWAGGKGANLGELRSAGFPVLDAFVVGTPAYSQFLAINKIREPILECLQGLDKEDTEALQKASMKAQDIVRAASIPEEIREAILTAYEDGYVAVRSSATAEDSPTTSFAGMNETFLNVVGQNGVLESVKCCWLSLFSPRSIYYRLDRAVAEETIKIAVIVQKQVASEKSGVMFTCNPATGNSEEIVIESAFGLGDLVVSGGVSPDLFVVGKEDMKIRESKIKSKEFASRAGPAGGESRRSLSKKKGLRASLGEKEIKDLAEFGREIERHYKKAQDTEWAIDSSGRIWIMQTRPITTSVEKSVAKAPSSPSLLSGLGVAPGVGGGKVRIVDNLKTGSRDFKDGEVLVTHMTAPDWVPLMRKAAAVVTDSGGITCHAAIVSRELGVPCIVGTGKATEVLETGQEITIDSRYGQIYAGKGALPKSEEVISGDLPDTKTKILVNLSQTEQIEHAAGLAVDGVGLLRAEFLLLDILGGKHPRLFIKEDGEEEFVSRLSEALQKFSDGFRHRPVTYRAMDFKSNEFRNLEGGEEAEPEEANPMIGYRGALRYTKEPDLFDLELQAVKQVWDKGGRNLHLMLPFVRRPDEFHQCKKQIRRSGLLENPRFQLWIMAEVPSVLYHLERYKEIGLYGISIGSNDLTQLLLGADRDSELLAGTFDERDEAVEEYIKQLIWRAKCMRLKTSICGQAPSVYPEYTKMLVEAGIDSISVNTDSVEKTRRLAAEAEEALRERAPRRLLAESPL